ncbi:hypothetical protein EJB05_38790, partial [Eragrostis curvula]
MILPIFLLRRSEEEENIEVISRFRLPALDDRRSCILNCSSRAARSASNSSSSSTSSAACSRSWSSRSHSLTKSSATTRSSAARSVARMRLSFDFSLSSSPSSMALGSAEGPNGCSSGAASRLARNAKSSRKSRRSSTSLASPRGAMGGNPCCAGVWRLAGSWVGLSATLDGV